MQRIPLTLLDQHVDAIRAVVREYARPDLLDAATALTRRLREVTDEFLKVGKQFPAGLSGKHFCAAAGSRRLDQAATGQSSSFDTFRHQPIAEQARFLARGFGGEAAQ